MQINETNFLPDIGEIQSKNPDKIIFIAKKVCAEHLPKFRIRAGKVGTVKTDLNVLAKATALYEGGKVDALSSDAANFNKRYDMGEKGYKPVENYKRQHLLQKVFMVGLADSRVTLDANTLCKNILLFNRIGYAVLKKDLALYKNTVDVKVKRLEKLIEKSYAEYEDVLNNNSKALILLQVNRLRTMVGRLKNSKPHVTYNVNTEVIVNGIGFNVFAITVLKAFSEVRQVHVPLTEYLNFKNIPELKSDGSTGDVWRPANEIRTFNVFFGNHCIKHSSKMLNALKFIS